jgi:hypothetical protein
VFEKLEIHCRGELKLALGECPVWHGQQLWLMDCRELALINALNLHLSS